MQSPQYQKSIIVRFRTVNNDTVDICGHTFKIIKHTTTHSQAEQMVIDDEEYNFPKELEFYSSLISENESVSELLAEIKKDPNVEQAFENFGPAPPPI